MSNLKKKIAKKINKKMVWKKEKKEIEEEENKVPIEYQGKEGEDTRLKFERAERLRDDYRERFTR